MFPDELFNFLDFDGGTIAFDVPKKVFYFLYVLLLPNIAPSKLKIKENRRGSFLLIWSQMGGHYS